MTTVTVDVLARDEASRVFTRVGSSAEHSSGMLRRFGTTLAGVFTGAALYDGARELTRFLVESGQAAAEDQQSQARLALQLRNSADATDGTVASVERWITAQGKALGVADDDLRPALARAATSTHDVAEAEDQVSLAMNVATGRGKSLATVEEALAKARQGNVSGLARLGAVTKDAAGNTVSYNDIVKQLSQTFAGQAAAAAHTTAGEYQRLQVQVHELEEGLGYKLLPVGLAVGQWMLGTAVPAAVRLGGVLSDELGPDVQRLSHWLSENRDEFESLATTVGKDALTVLKTTGEVVGDLVGFFDRLPGPVKTLGVEVGVAALVFPRLEAGIVGTTTAVRSQIATLAQWRAEMTYTELRTDAATRAGVKLGNAARTAAGAAGIGLLIDSARRGDTALGTLEQTAGAAATGFSVAGPWGAAAGAVGVLGTKMFQTGNKAQQAYDQMKNDDPVKDAQRKFQDLAGTLDQVTGAYTSATRAAVLQQLSAKPKGGGPSILDTATQFGISSRTLVNAALGQQSAITATANVVQSYQGNLTTLDAKIQAVTDSTDSYVTGRDKYGRSMTFMTDAAKQELTTLGDQRNALKGNLTELQKMPGALAAQAVQIQKTSAATTDYSGKLKGLPKDLKTQVRADGVLASRDAIVDLARQYHLTPKEIRTLVTATGTDNVQSLVRQVIATLQRADKTTATPRVGVDTGNSTGVLAGIINQIARVQSKRVVITVDTVHHGSSGNPQASQDGDGPAQQQPSGSAPTQRSAPKSAGASPAELTQLGIRGWNDKGISLVRQNLDSGTQKLLTDLAAGLKKGFNPLSTVLDRATTKLQDVTDDYNTALANQAAIAGGFGGFQSSVFGVQGSQDAAGNQQPATLAQIMAQSSSNADSSGQLNSDVQTLLGEGMNRALLLQMQQEGPAGEANIHTLAIQASLQDIATLNAQQDATDTNLTAAGTAVADKLDGASVAAAAAAVQQATLLKGILDALTAEKVTSVEVNGAQIVAAVSRHFKNQGNNSPWHAA